MRPCVWLYVCVCIVGVAVRVRVSGFEGEAGSVNATGVYIACWRSMCLRSCVQFGLEKWKKRVCERERDRERARERERESERAREREREGESD